MDKDLQKTNTDNSKQTNKQLRTNYSQNGIFHVQFQENRGEQLEYC